jgi:integrase
MLLIVNLKRKSTRQLLKKIKGVQWLYRHSVNDTYYAQKKINGKRKEHSLGTPDRKIAERRLKVWIANLAEVDSGAEKMTLAVLLEKFKEANQGKARKTKQTNESIINRFKATWSHGLGIRVSQIRTSQLNTWLAAHESRLKNSSYNRYTAFLRQLFEIAVADRVIAANQNPYNGVKTKWKRPQKPQRNVPTEEQFQRIVESIRSQRLSDSAEGTADFVEFLGRAGLGQAEASSLTWADIDWNESQIAIKRQKTGTRFFVPFYFQLEPLLKRLYAKCQQPVDPAEKVFRIRDAKKALTSACKRLGFPHFSQRNLRQVLIRELWQKGIDRKLIAQWQGHRDGGKLIMDTYTEVFCDDDASYRREQLKKLAPRKQSVSVFE